MTAEPDAANSEADAVQPVESASKSKSVVPAVEETSAAGAPLSADSDTAEGDSVEDASTDAAPSVGVVETSQTDERNDNTVADRIRALRKRVKEYQEEKFGSEADRTDQ